ncbi:MAG: SpoIID/LytB domain-containing protein [Candidatus Babeliales bacterium]
MKKNLVFLSIIFLHCSILKPWLRLPATLSPAFKKKVSAQSVSAVRILIQKFSDLQSVEITSLKGFTVKTNLDRYPQPTLKITFKNNALYLNNKKQVGDRIFIIPKNGLFSLQSSAYQGSLEIKVNNGEALLINHISLEDYIYSVLKTESWPGWPLEVNKVLAVACRTYAVRMILEAQSVKRLYDMTNNNTHQTYSGHHTTDILKQAVTQTKGIIISDGNEPILAMFDSCCGNILPSKTTHFDFSKAQYLARNYKCSYCKKYPIYSWQAEFPLTEFLQKVCPDWQNRRIAKVFLKKDNAGIVKEVILKSGNQKKLIDGSIFYATFKEIKSYCFDVYKKNNMVRIKGRGYGHHIGLCQWGACEMIKRGFNYKRVLLFYYPKTVLTSIEQNSF